MLSSFDVFDTCLARRVAVPTDLFWELGPIVAQAAGLEGRDEIVEEFAWARVRGEELARERSGKEDVTLDLIWKETCRLLGWDPSPEFMELELAAERRNLFPIGVASDLVEEARRRSGRVIFISDTYFPRSFLETRLTEHGFLKPGDGLYLSGELGKTKWTGTLFQHVLAEEGIRPSQLHHTGDNAHSDGSRPRELGVRSTVVRHHRFTQTEACLASSEVYPREQGSWAGAMRMSRLHSQSRALGGELAVVSQFIGPFLLSFTAWVLDQARRSGIRRLYFASRDCQMAHHVAKHLAPRFGGIDCRYLLISRQSLLLPLIREVSRERLPWLRRAYEQNDLAGILAKIELTVDETADHWEGLLEPGLRPDPHVVLQDEGTWERFWTRLQNPELVALIQSRAASRRQSALAYFEAQDLLDEVPSALVDLGWSLTSQKALNELLVTEGGRREALDGFYLQQIHQRPPASEVGRAKALFPPVPMDRQRDLELTLPHQYAEMLEHTLGLADHGSVHHYDGLGDGEGARLGEIVPMGSDGPLEHLTSGLPVTLREGVVAFAKAHADLACRGDSVSTQSTRQRLRLLMDDVLRSPPANLVEEVRTILCSQDQNHRFSRTLVRPLTVRDEWPGGSRTAAQPDPVWLEGSLTLTGRSTLALRSCAGWLRSALPPSVKRGLKKVVGRP